MSLLALMAVLIVHGTIIQTGPCAVVTGPLLPDLVPNPKALHNNIKVEVQTFSADSCEVAEGSVPVAGSHTLLRFTSESDNIGQADLFIGNPALCPLLFEWSPCHQHFHIKGYTAYRLWTLTGWDNWVAKRDLNQVITGTINETLLNAAVSSGDLIVGHKQGFCLENSVKVPGFPNRSTSYQGDCAYQSLNYGFGDIYYWYLSGQWVVIDGLKKGTYMLENQVNPEHLLPESDYTNNSTAISWKYGG